jgi:hypothetical protein
VSYGAVKWASQNTRAPAAVKRKKSARRTAKKSSKRSAQPAKKKKPTTKRKAVKAPKKKAPKKKAAKKPAAKKAKLYTRYDPTTGQKVRVTADTFEYSTWPSRKPSKKKIQREALKSDPLGTVGMLGAAAGKKAVERAGEKAGRDVLRSVSKSVGIAGAATAGRGAIVASVAPAVAAAGLIGAALYAMGRLGQARNVAAGERANQISRTFAAAQQDTMKAVGASRWEDVPLDLRTKLVNGYKKEIQNVYSTAIPLAGTIRPSQALPYGR